MSFSGNFPGNYTENAAGNYTGNFGGKYSGNYTGNFTGNSGGNYTGNSAEDPGADAHFKKISGLKVHQQIVEYHEGGVREHGSGMATGRRQYQELSLTDPNSNPSEANPSYLQYWAPGIRVGHVMIDTRHSGGANSVQTACVWCPR
jgi:voltage-gated sodium channel type IV alpha